MTTQKSHSHKKNHRMKQLSLNTLYFFFNTLTHTILLSMVKSTSNCRLWTLFFCWWSNGDRFRLEKNKPNKIVIFLNVKCAIKFLVSSLTVRKNNSIFIKFLLFQAIILAHFYVLHFTFTVINGLSVERHPLEERHHLFSYKKISIVNSS